MPIVTRSHESVGFIPGWRSTQLQAISSMSGQPIPVVGVKPNLKGKSFLAQSILGLPPQTWLTPDRRISGDLGLVGRDVKRGDRFIDQYEFVTLQPGQQIHVELNSTQFDTYLQLIDYRTGRVLLANDDAESGTTHSSLTFTVRSNRQYGVRVTSFSQEATGKYRLKTTSFKPIQSRDFRFLDGYGLVDAAAGIAGATRSVPFPSVSTPEDATWAHAMLNVPGVWAQGYTGQGVTVAVLDTGVDYRHRDLQENIWRNPGEIAGNRIDDDRNGFIDDIRGWNFARRNNRPLDVDGHGTHVAGTIAALRNSFGVTGVAYDAKIMPVKVLNDDGFGSDTTIAKGIRYAVQNGADVVNMSLGGSPGYPLGRSVKTALRLAARKGVVVVLASGNERQSLGATQPGEPAYFAALNQIGIAVGAVDRDRTIANFSNPTGNRKLGFVVAPGVNIRSTFPEDDFAVESGTSMATPHVSGVVALMLSANPSLTPSQVKSWLTTTTTPVRRDGL